MSKSPYSSTRTQTKYFRYLDTWTPPVIAFSDFDQTYIIESKYNQRPDLLAYDLYGSTRLWWIFSYRNPDILVDGVRDMIPGLEIFLPNKTQVDNL